MTVSTSFQTFKRYIHSKNTINIQLLLSEAIDPDLDINVMMQIFNPDKLPKLEALDCTKPDSFLTFANRL